MSTTRVLLTSLAVELVVENPDHPTKYGLGRFEGLEVKSDDAGNRYVELDDPLDPAAVTPAIHSRFIRRVSYKGRYREGHRPDGIYKWRGATARIETQRDVYPSREYSQTDRYQNISISAGSIRTLREIYTKVRAGELRPTADWSITEGEIIAQREREVNAPAAEATTED